MAVLLAGCAELGVVGDGTSLSVGKANNGHIVDGVKIPDRGEGFMTRDVWRDRGNRYGTDEMIDLLTGVGRRMAARFKERIVIGDISQRGGGDAHIFHRSHQSGRDVDITFYVRDPEGKPVEPDKMRAFDANLVAKDKTGYTVDVPRTWLLVRELVTAPEAAVQWTFLYEPISVKLLEHARSIGEPDEIIVKARKALLQPGNSNPHNDHIHVRIYCSTADRAYGCVDYGPMELMEERATELASGGGVLLALPVAKAAPPSTGGDRVAKTDFKTIGRLLRTRTDLLLQRWR